MWKKFALQNMERLSHPQEYSKIFELCMQSSSMTVLSFWKIYTIIFDTAPQLWCVLKSLLSSSKSVTHFRSKMFLDMQSSPTALSQDNFYSTSHTLWSARSQEMKINASVIFVNSQDDSLFCTKNMYYALIRTSCLM